MEGASGYLTVQVEDGHMVTRAEWKNADIITRFMVLSKCFEALQIPVTVENLAMLKTAEETFRNILLEDE